MLGRIRSHGRFGGAVNSVEYLSVKRARVGNDIIARYK